MDGGDPARRIYHRCESPTQTPAVAKLQEVSGEIWGRPSIFNPDVPKVKAYRGPLKCFPRGRGIEFTTDVDPDRGGVPWLPEWSGPRPGVRVEGGFAKIKAVVTKNTQT